MIEIMGNSLDKEKVGIKKNTENVENITMLKKLITVQQMLMLKFNSKGNYTMSVKKEIIKQMVEIEQVIAILNYMDDSILLRKFNIK